ncbi:MAG: 50S ribosomal protein L32 [Clostridia bacterium]|nr:50S ribosomal protein L32 [Clostridia bacterium]
MIAPKKKVSKQRKHLRRSSVWKLDMPGMFQCPNCGEYVLSHRVCKACGYYDGKQVLKTNKEAAK